jgi:hypothetical protein
MKENESLYYQSLKYLITSDELLINDNNLIIYFAYRGIKFIPPNEINAIKITHLYNIEKQGFNYAKDGLLRYLEIEPLEVIKNYVRLKINAYVSLETNNTNYSLVLECLNSIEKESFLKIVGDKKSNNLNMNIVTHYIDFLYDCAKAQFVLFKHQKIISNA